MVKSTPIRLIYFHVIENQYATNIVICVLRHKQSELGTGRGSYTLVVLVSLLVSVMITKLTSLSDHCFVIALYFSCICILHVDKLCECYNFYSGNGHKQLLPGCFVPCALGMRLVVTHICALSASYFQRDESLYVCTHNIHLFYLYITMTAALSSSMLYS